MIELIELIQLIFGLTLVAFLLDVYWVGGHRRVIHGYRRVTHKK
jgi:hypothetical protein